MVRRNPRRQAIVFQALAHADQRRRLWGKTFFGLRLHHHQFQSRNHQRPAISICCCPDTVRIIDNMAQNKSAKRKRNAQAQKAQKLAKTVATVTPPPESASLEPKTLQSVTSEEELEITIDTLATLAKYPHLTKSKLCRDLRVAVYDFRTSCNTGSNAAGE